MFFIGYSSLKINTCYPLVGLLPFKYDGQVYFVIDMWCD